MSAITWAHTYNPRIVRGADVTLLPTPIFTTGETFVKQHKTVKVPLKDGVIISGITRGGLQVSMNGWIVGTSKEEALAKKSLLQQKLVDSNQTFTFYRYYDAVGGNYRWYENCVLQELGFDAGSQNPANGVIPYRMTLLVPSGQEKETVTLASGTPNALGYSSGVPWTGSGEGSSDTIPGAVEYLYGPLVVKLNSGGAFLVQDSNGDYIFRVNDDGTVESTGFIEQVDTITPPS